jgi:hypothetical protein
LRNGRSSQILSTEVIKHGGDATAKQRLHQTSVVDVNRAEEPPKSKSIIAHGLQSV